MNFMTVIEPLKSWLKKRFQRQDADLRIIAYKVDELDEKLKYIISELENK